VVIGFRNRIKRGLFPGPDSLVAGLIIDTSPFPIKGLVADRTQKSISEIVADQAAQGVDYIKLYTGLSAGELKEGIEAAHENNILAVTHMSDVSWTVAANLGIDAVVHMIPTSPDLLPENVRESYLESRRTGAFEFYEWYEKADLDAPEIKEMIEVMAKKKVHIDATLIVFYLAFWGDQPDVINANNHLSHPEMVLNWKTTFRFDLGWQADDYKRAKAIWPKVLRLTKMMHDAGVPMTLGTDQNNPFVAPGRSLYQEMKLHSDAGISNWDILNMATSRAADILGISNRTGRIQVGLEADIIFLEKDPAPNLSNIDSITAVLTNGTFYIASELIKN